MKRLNAGGIQRGGAWITALRFHAPGLTRSIPQVYPVGSTTAYGSAVAKSKLDRIENRGYFESITEKGGGPKKNEFK
jgi:hypothetical protein